jgi:membrane protein required for colicin V production
VNQVDVLLLVTLVPFALRGWGRGFCRETLGLTGLVGGVLLATAGGAPLATTLTARGLLSPLAARLAAPATLFAGAVVAAHVVGRVADRLARALLLGGVNRIAGLVFGTLKGAALLGFALLLAEHVAPSAPLSEAVAGSRLASPLTRLAAGIVEAGRGLAVHPTGQQV